MSSNILFALMQRMRGGPCTPITDDLAVKMARGNVRQPDVSVDCGEGSGDDLALAGAKAVFEVLSPSKRRIDLVCKSEGYRGCLAWRTS